MSYHEHYVEKGSGPAVVFSHGTLMDATMFAPQIDYLAERGYRAIAYNSRVLTGEPGLHTLDDLAEDCRRLLDRLGIDKCVVAGMSVGGCMAMPFALKHQDRLNGLILIAVTSQAYPPEEQAAFEAEFDKLDVDGMMPREFAEWAAPYCFGETTYAENMALVDHWIDRWATTVPARSVFCQGKSWIKKDDITDRLGEIEVPVLIIHGEEDVPIPIERALPMVDVLPDATLARVPKAGHTANLEQAAVVNEAIGSFLERIASQ